MRKLTPFKFNNDNLYTTNIDTSPYIVFQSIPVIKGKYNIEGVLYTLISYDSIKSEAIFKMDKYINLLERRVNVLESHYKAWGQPKTIKQNYAFSYNGDDLQLNIDGKLSKNQMISVGENFYKITDLKKKDGLTYITSDILDVVKVQSVYPYKENNNIIHWYTDIGDVWLKQAREFKKKNEGIA